MTHLYKIPSKYRSLISEIRKAILSSRYDNISVDTVVDDIVVPVILDLVNSMIDDGDIDTGNGSLREEVRVAKAARDDALRHIGNLVDSRMDKAVRERIESREREVKEREEAVSGREAGISGKETEMVRQETIHQGNMETLEWGVAKAKEEINVMLAQWKQCKAEIEFDRGLHRDRCRELDTMLNEVTRLIKEYGSLDSQSEKFVTETLFEYFGKDDDWHG